ncbi:hypothetical protein [Microbacterium sp. SLBN-146]|uniref:hypothetical protein n=1 Tax=Microbacterium sp. SLBN-146 TaxID=2768457 RepID=UPI00114FA85C|nr:hypothetical protein [Microbacterium sp. SLBN-146]TQJ30700.1 hypothetical protein FBY39_1157 [Microbacterium sp. SLBN-146]
MTVLTLRRHGVSTIVEPERSARVDDITTVRLGLSGGALVFDVTDADSLPRVEVFDIDAASWWLFSVYGYAAAERIVEFAHAADDGHEEPAAEELAGERGPRLDSLLRLALALWMRRWWPTPSAAVPELTEWLLDAEAGVLADDLEIALDRDRALAERLLAPHLERMAANLAAHDARLDASPVDARIDQVLRAAAAVALDVVDPAEPGFDGLDAIDRAVRHADDLTTRLRSGLADDDALAAAIDAIVNAGLESSEPGEEHEIYALAAGDDDEGSLVQRGSAPVDPRAVAPRILSTADDAIVWEVHATAGGLRCDVTVQTSPAAELAKIGRFFARVDQDGSSSVVALQRLGGQLHGEVWLDASIGDRSLVVTVYDGIDGFDGVAPRSADLRARERDAIARIIGARARVASAGPQDGWQGPFAAELGASAKVPLQ